MALAPDAHADRRPRPGRRLGRGLRAETHRIAKDVDQGSIMGLELVAGVLLWAGLGWLADGWLGTGPWLLGIGAMTGFFGGLYLVWLRSARMEGGPDAPGTTAPPPPGGRSGG